MHDAMHLHIICMIIVHIQEKKVKFTSGILLGNFDVKKQQNK